jgi:hypothetical protein
MNDQYFGEGSNTSDYVMRTDQNTTSLLVNSDSVIDKVPEDAALVYEVPMGGTVPAVDRMNGPLSDGIPMGETVVPVALMDEAIAPDVLMSEAIPFKAPLSESIVEESHVTTPVLYNAPMNKTITHDAPVSTTTGSLAALLNREESEHLRTRWNEIQGKFVDEPRSAVQQADALVSEVIGQITEMFATEHRSLESQWDKGNDASTEDLRKALQRYRSFFNRLVV